eukprot:363759-Chlamydomonas_euryale.AAC.9
MRLLDVRAGSCGTGGSKPPGLPGLPTPPAPRSGASLGGAARAACGDAGGRPHGSPGAAVARLPGPGAAPLPFPSSGCATWPPCLCAGESGRVGESAAALTGRSDADGLPKPPTPPTLLTLGVRRSMSGDDGTPMLEPPAAGASRDANTMPRSRPAALLSASAAENMRDTRTSCSMRCSSPATACLSLAPYSLSSCRLGAGAAAADRASASPSRRLCER